MGQLKDPFLLQFPSFQIQTQFSRFNTDNLMSRSIYLNIDFIQLALVLALNGKHGNKSASKVCVERDTKNTQKKTQSKTISLLILFTSICYNYTNSCVFV